MSVLIYKFNLIKTKNVIHKFNVSLPSITAYRATDSFVEASVIVFSPLYWALCLWTLEPVP